MDYYSKLITLIDDEENRESFLEKLFSFFQIDLENWYEIEFILVFKGRMSISDIDSMEYYRVQYFMENYKKYMEEEKARNEEKNGKDLFNNPEKFMKQSQGMMKNSASSAAFPKIPTSFPKF